MVHEQAFWERKGGEGDPRFWVCMGCLSEVFWQKIPNPDCPTCHHIATYEDFTLKGIMDWGTEELIAKAIAASLLR
jgi:hypothetical protein